MRKGIAMNPLLAGIPPDPMLRSARWQDTGNPDPRLPRVVLMEFSATGFEPAAFARHAVPFPAALARAVPKRQAEFLAGRLVARTALEALGIRNSIPGVGTSREPLWPAGATGSITHTREACAAIAVPSERVSGVGIDIENLVEAAAGDAIRELALAPAEQSLLEAQRMHLSAGMALTIAFSAKESFFKGTFARVGRFFDFDAVRVTRLHAPTGCLELTLAETLCPDLPEGRAFRLGFKQLSEDTVLTSFVW